MAVHREGIDGPSPTSDVLAGRGWWIESIDGVLLTAGTGATLEFGRDGRVSGSTGVNQFTASYVVTGEHVATGPVAMTRRACAPDELHQEELVVAAVAGECSFRFDGAALELHGRMGTVVCWPLEWDPEPGPPPTA
jgi:putative lipoprotein